MVNAETMQQIAKCKKQQSQQILTNKQISDFPFRPTPSLVQFVALLSLLSLLSSKLGLMPCFPPMPCR